MYVHPFLFVHFQWSIQKLGSIRMYPNHEWFEYFGKMDAYPFPCVWHIEWKLKTHELGYFTFSATIIITCHCWYWWLGLEKLEKMKIPNNVLSNIFLLPQILAVVAAPLSWHKQNKRSKWWKFGDIGCTLSKSAERPTPIFFHFNWCLLKKYIFFKVKGRYCLASCLEGRGRFLSSFAKGNYFRIWSSPALDVYSALVCYVWAT